MSDSDGGYNFLAGFLIGSALGAMAALLLTPKTGKEFRDTIATESKKLKEKTEGAVAELREKGGDAYEKARGAISETTEGVKKAARSLKQTSANEES
jgi:gas vesicle protein